MKKFKIKNRPKRKYTKKIQTPTPSNPYKTATSAGMIPLLFIILASFNIYLFQTQIAPRQTPDLKITLPAIPALTLPSTNTIQQITSTRLKEITHAINTTKNITRDIPQIFEQTTALFTTIIKQMQITAQNTTQAISQLLQANLKTLNNLSTTISRLIHNAIQTIIFTIRLTIENISTSLLLTFQNSMRLLFQVQTLVHKMTQTIIFTIKFTINALSVFLFNAATYLIKTLFELLVLASRALIKIKLQIVQILTILLKALLYPSVLMNKWLEPHLTKTLITTQHTMTSLQLRTNIVLEYISKQLEKTIKLLTNDKLLNHLTQTQNNNKIDK
jgi:hypothetical protein